MPYYFLPVELQSSRIGIEFETLDEARAAAALGAGSWVILSAVGILEVEARTEMKTNYTPFVRRGENKK